MTVPVARLRPFLERPEVSEAIEYLEDAPSLSIVTGTGTSAEMGFPLWDELVRRLLLLAVANDGHLKSEQDKVDFVSALLRQGPIAGASYAQALLGDKADQVLGTALYEGV